MWPDALWPNLPRYANFTPADHAAHTTRRGVHLPDDVGMGPKSTKQLLKSVSKPHLKMKGPQRTKRRKKT